MAKKILYQDNARRALERGMEIMVEAVSVTLGPKGRNVVLEKAYGSPQIVNDGVTIAREINLKEHIEEHILNLSANLDNHFIDFLCRGCLHSSYLVHDRSRF